MTKNAQAAALLSMMVGSQIGETQWTYSKPEDRQPPPGNPREPALTDADIRRIEKAKARREMRKRKRLQQMGARSE